MLNTKISNFYKYLLHRKKVLSKENLPILSLVLKFSNLKDCNPDIIIISQQNMIRLSGINLSTDLNINLFQDQINSIKNGLK